MGPGGTVAWPVWLTSSVGPQDYCGRNASSGSFSIITENVPCGTTGVTCSKAIKIFLGVSAAGPWGTREPSRLLGRGQ